MSRRASDRAKTRVQYLLLALAVVSSTLATVIGYKAIRAMDDFSALMEAAAQRRARPLTPEGF